MVDMPNHERWPAQDDRPRVWQFMRWPDGHNGFVWHGVKHADTAADDLGGAYAPELRLSEDEWARLPGTDDQTSETFQTAVDALAWPPTEQPQGGRK